jgi:hypothetical protein
LIARGLGSNHAPGIKLIRARDFVVAIRASSPAVNALVERKHPLVWQLEGVKRVLESAMKKEDQTLVLLYSEVGWADEAMLVSWVEYSSLTMFRCRILEPLHQAKLIEYDTKLRRAGISPRGAKSVEDRLLK